VHGQRKPIIGLAGGIGAGKSEVARLLGRLGAAVVEADEVNREELRRPETIETLTRWWGRDVLCGPRELNRQRIAEIIFADSEQRKRLERWIHPRLAARRQERIAAYQAELRVRAIALDAPLLFEAGLADDCDVIVFVEADRAVRLARVARDRGWTEEELDRRENAQKPLEFKRDCADYVVSNNSGLDALAAQVTRVFSHILTQGNR
jgi:dephospho-CoA kinase